MWQLPLWCGGNVVETMPPTLAADQDLQSPEMQ